ncbi:hypothetical protein RJT34_22657 [Clitoria ternatea]|uniref:Uncharacterized protein n=1 Tax=Clitoria ternatea TaxID=43366 RepID=A0AAN9IFS3_CLITE
MIKSCSVYRRLLETLNTERVPANGRCLFEVIVHRACLRNGEKAPDENRERELADELRARGGELEILMAFHVLKWELPQTTHSILASTANELREDRNVTNVHPEKSKAAAKGLTYEDESKLRNE